MREFPVVVKFPEKTQSFGPEELRNRLGCSQLLKTKEDKEQCQ